MTYLFGFGLLVLAGAMVVLFAMLGELYARTGGMEGAGAPGGGSGAVRLLDGARVGSQPDGWPIGLAEVPASDLRVVLVLSTACDSCEQVAGQINDLPDLRDFAVLVSTIDQDRGVDFVTRHELSGLPHHIDVGGEWVAGELGVMTSPSALVFRHGRLVSALLFTDLAALSAAVFPVKEAVGNE
ncbi:hypothetical protein GA0074695_1113 [Micromonospora viridifaciens]|uniref:Thioredoxin domain-containing protein n=1 Tax=Micromonospora viridifaciens TaxID=1881 RepID=A0A1C4V4C6_MICVI|nr:hypothetical protein [Micromonospora viridifaciens]SCE78736.1 hypothetical protein GA0074695_1113 [Micromonospora viridifaciens]